jgi:hypothetical protein
MSGNLTKPVAPSPNLYGPNSNHDTQTHGWGFVAYEWERGEAYYNVTQWTLSILKYNVHFELHGPRVDVKS